MERRHILLVPSWYPARPDDIKGCFFRDQALALSDHGHQVGVIDVQFRSLRQVFHPSLLIQGPFGLTEEIDESISTVRFHGLNWTERLPHLDRLRWLHHGRQLAARYVETFGRPDLLHAHSMLNGGLLAMELSTMLGIPYVVTEHATGFLIPVRDESRLALLGQVAGNAASRIAVGADLCQALEKQLPASGNWDEVPNVLSRRFETSERTVPGVKPLIFLTVSLLTRKKAVDNLIRAFAIAFPEGDERLRIGGDGPDRMRLEALVAQLGIEDRVSFCGKLTRNAVLKEMADSSVFVLPSHVETFGVVLIEALALGRPVIATRSGGPESIVRDEDGLLVPKDDPDALARAMNEMRSNYGDYDGAKIRQACLDRYGGAAIADRLTNIYSSVLNNAV